MRFCIISSSRCAPCFHGFSISSVSDFFAKTQGDAWFKPSEENVHAGVCVRVTNNDGTGQGQFRVFPYENRYLEPFEAAVAEITASTTRLLRALPPRRQPPTTVPPLRRLAARP